MGEPAGVGGEIVLKAWRSRLANIPPFFVIDDARRLQRLSESLGLGVPVGVIDAASEAVERFATALPVVHRPLPRRAVPGTPDPENAAAVIAAIEIAVAMVQAGEAAAVITNPIHKKSLYDAGFRFPGHTEFLAALAGGDVRPVMMLACPVLRVVPVTVHVSLRQAIETLHAPDIVDIAHITFDALRRDFGIARPRLAVAGLNPHAGEDGTMGDEESTIIAPAIARLRAQGLDVAGPLPPDTLFSSRARKGYDAALCMYHDQALIPLKALDFDGGVNVTLGLPFVRTSPDHGTAFDIAGSGQASEASLTAALILAANLARGRGDGAQ
ncbi:MAG: 4-hydroxythreonine-4-phosphate dehydrogenase PdxA [Rhodospirillales bacterium]|nr:4-hydroxythreonine-4-phosphate dehydrogenase PdxA [Rhodospirillales bacterium]